jgi:hypothetical protein
MSELITLASVSAPDAKLRSMSIILRGVSEQVADELGEMDPDQFAIMMAQIGLIVEWVGTGDKGILTDSLKVFAEKIEPSSPVVPDEDLITPEAELHAIEGVVATQ